MANKTYQIKITLKGSKPSIWRRLLIPSDLLLSDFHKIIQSTMGWTNSHLHQFKHNRAYYAPKNDVDDFGFDDYQINYSKIKVGTLLKNEKDKMVYEYDFGDGWEHNIVLEKIENISRDKKEVTCLTGKNNCPPEDCGGIDGYYNLLEIIQNPNHELYEEYTEWLGREFDPTHFDLEEINEMLRSEDWGIFDMFEDWCI
ncbi:MAG: plasmid pRiA4b ORF-3 family protein [Candidatus Saccharimonadaceae bacterium]